MLRRLMAHPGTTVLALAGLLAALGLWLLDRESSVGTQFQQASYDAYYSWFDLAEGPPATCPVVIVYLDLASYIATQRDPTTPWPRSVHAELLRRLTAAQARAVVFDIVFDGPGADPAANQVFADAMRANGRVLLAGELGVSSQRTADGQGGRSIREALPLKLFQEAAAGWGLGDLAVDEDFVPRLHFAGRLAEGQPALSTAVGRLLGLPSASGEAVRAPRWMRHYGGPFVLPHVSYEQALDRADVPDEVFRDRVVFVGARPMAGVFKERRDEFRSPYRSWRRDDLFMPGVEVHATQTLNLIRGDWLRRLPASGEEALIVVTGILVGMGFLRFRPLPVTFVALGSVGVVALTAGMVFSRASLWFPWLIIAAVQVPVAWAATVVFRSIEWYRTRRQMEAARRVAEAKIREQAALIDKAHDAILVQDLDGRLAYANPAAERLYGWSLGELQRDGSALELFSPDAGRSAEAARIAREAGEWNGELHQQTRDGRIVTVESRWTLIRDEAGRPKALLIIGSDVTEKKQLEAQFLRTQRMETIGTLAGGMAHDLNNALSPILMGTQLLRRKFDDPEALRLLGLMESSTQRGAEMVRQVLLFARGRDGDFERLAPGPLVKEMEKLVRETFPKSITVESFVPADLWPVRGNPTQLHQVLLNLSVNARDAMPGGGRLTFVADNVELTTEEAAILPEANAGPHVSLMVSDTGIGMTPEVRARIFEPFFSTKGEGRGTGIGLATVMRIVKSHGGCLRVESEPGHGTSFEILLPCAVETAPLAVATELDELPRGHGELILVADDEQAIRDLVAGALTSQGYRVITAANGLEVMQLFREHSDSVRLLLTDSAMPLQDGLRTIAAIRRLSPNLPVILASGEMDITNDELRCAGGMLLRKPYALDEVLRAVAEGCVIRRAAVPAAASPPGEVL